MSQLIIGQYVPGQSYWHKLDPRSKIITTSLFVIASFLINNLIAMCGFMLVVVLALYLTRLPYSYFFKSLIPILFFVGFTFVLQVLFNQEGELLFQLGFVKIYSQGLIIGALMSLRLMLVVVISTLLTLTTKPTNLTLALETLFKPFKKVGVPVSELALMISIALRFIPTLLEETQKILKAQASRGVDIREGKFKEKIMQIVSLLVPLFILSFKRADDLANAMEVRGYVPGQPRTSINRLYWKAKDSVLVGIGVLLLICGFIF